MEINYAVIIKHLCSKTINNNDKKYKYETNKFVSQKNIHTYSNTFPEFFKQILNDKFYRYGITVYDSENNNISFWSSVMTILDKNFIIPYESDDLQMINQFKSQLLNLYDKNNVSEFIKKFDKNDLREKIKLNPDITIIQYMTDILDINCVIFKNRKISSPPGTFSLPT
jgi:hypothetical protein